MIAHSFSDIRAYLRESFAESMLALKENRVRTLMSIIGVAVGITAVMTVGIVSQGGRQYVFSELESFGLKTLWIYRERDQKNPLDYAREGSGITNEDYEAILSSGCCTAIKQFSAVVYSQDWQTTVKMGSLHARVNVEGVDRNYLAINNDQISQGRAFSEEDIRRRQAVALIGESVRKTLFNNHPLPIGKTLRIDNMQFTVIGLLKEKKRDFLTSMGATQGFDVNNRVLIPYTLYQQMLGIQDVQTLQAEVQDQTLITEGIAQIQAFLSKQHRGRFKYRGDSMLEWTQLANRILYGISFIGVLAASVSLVVGGIGIMNIMTTAVVERTREIGIRMAIGARRSNILWQFLLEAAVISVLGGVLGLILGLIVLVALANWSGFPLRPDIELILVAFGVAVMVGLASGFYPARRAAKMKPVEALRYD
ncbi:MAG: ABC transporter permease [Gammaproteobacteria bacterium]|nr:ABC transporter permease [Gammaproteobacteria bacterium]